MEKEIKKYKEQVLVEIAFWPNNIEYLYWEWTEEQFRRSIQFDYVFFPLYNRSVINTKIKDFRSTKNSKFMRDVKISHLEDGQKSKIKLLVENMKKNIWREPTDSEFEKMISHILQDEEKNIKKYSVVVCDYGHRHSIWETCTCFSIYKTFWILFQDELRKIGYEIRDKNEITKEMQEAFLEKQKQK